MFPVHIYSNKLKVEQKKRNRRKRHSVAARGQRPGQRTGEAQRASFSPATSSPSTPSAHTRSVRQSSNSHTNNQNSINDRKTDSKRNVNSGKFLDPRRPSPINTHVTTTHHLQHEHTVNHSLSVSPLVAPQNTSINTDNVPSPVHLYAPAVIDFDAHNHGNGSGNGDDDTNRGKSNISGAENKSTYKTNDGHNEPLNITLSHSPLPSPAQPPASSSLSATNNISVSVSPVPSPRRSALSSDASHDASHDANAALESYKIKLTFLKKHVRAQEEKHRVLMAAIHQLKTDNKVFQAQNIKLTSALDCQSKDGDDDVTNGNKEKKSEKEKHENASEIIEHTTEAHSRSHHNTEHTNDNAELENDSNTTVKGGVEKSNDAPSKKATCTNKRRSVIDLNTHDNGKRDTNNGSANAENVEEGDVESRIAAAVMKVRREMERETMEREKKRQAQRRQEETERDKERTQDKQALAEKDEEISRLRESLDAAQQKALAHLSEKQSLSESVSILRVEVRELTQENKRIRAQAKERMKRDSSLVSGGKGRRHKQHQQHQQPSLPSRNTNDYKKAHSNSRLSISSLASYDNDSTVNASIPPSSSMSSLSPQASSASSHRQQQQHQQQQQPQTQDDEPIDNHNDGKDSGSVRASQSSPFIEPLSRRSLLSPSPSPSPPPSPLPSALQSQSQSQFESDSHMQSNKNKAKRRSIMGINDDESVVSNDSKDTSLSSSSSLSTAAASASPPPSSSSAFINRHENEVDHLYEYESYLYMIGWHSPRLPTDPNHWSDITGRQKWGKYKYPIADGWEWLEDWKIDFGDDTEDQNKDDNREGDDNNDDDGGSEDADDDLASVKSNNTDITDGSYVDAAVSISGASSLDGKECSGDTGSADTDQGVEMKADEDKKISPLTSSASKHAVDAEGWQYSKSHLWGKYHPNKGKMDMARRRRWSRRRMKFDG